MPRQIRATNYMLSTKRHYSKKLCAERDAAHRAGITISQIHGPWQWPPHDSTDEERAERLDKMKKSVIICSLLGCQYMVVHPIMPSSTLDDEHFEMESIELRKIMVHLMETA